MTREDSSSRAPATRLRHSGTPGKGAVNPPLQRASTVRFDTLAELEAAAAAPHDGFFYGRFGTPTHAALAEALCAVSGATGAAFYPSGLAAVVGVILAYVRAGGEILVADCVYAPTRKFCDGPLRALGVRSRYFPPTAGADIAEWLSPDTQLILCESPGSLTLELQDLPALAATAAEQGVPVAVDNTWGTPLYSPVLAHGAAVDIQSATKYLSGHADLMLGAALCAAESLPAVRRAALAYGYCVSPDDAWQTLRGLRTLDLRLQRHAATARLLGDWLASQPEVRQVIDPARPEHPQHALWQRDFSGANGLLSVELSGVSRRALAACTDGLELFGLGFSWGGFESLCLPFDPAPIRSHGDWDGRGPFLRFHAGLEAPEDLIADLEAGFRRLRAA